MEQRRLPVFADRFSELRGEKTQDEFAKFLGISRPTVGFYENGTRLPDALVLKQIAEKCNVSADWLLGLSNYQDTETANLTAEDIGLSETAVSVLQQYHQIGTNKVIETINALLENDPFDNQNVLRCISAYLFFEKSADRDYKITDGGLIIEKNLYEAENDEDGMTDFQKDLIMSLFIPYLYTLTDNTLFEEALFNLASTGLRKLKENLKKRREESGDGISETEDD